MQQSKFSVYFPDFKSCRFHVWPGKKGESEKKEVNIYLSLNYERMALRNFRLGYLCLIAVFKKASVLKNQLKPLHYGKQLGGVSLGFGMYSAILSDENVKKGQKSGPIPLTKVQITRTVRELLRFQEFASLSVGEEFFMTPKDFLDAMTLTNPRPRMRRKRLSPEQASRYPKTFLEIIHWYRR